MKKFRVYVQKDSYETYDVEADNENAAKQEYKTKGIKIGENHTVISETVVEKED
ncbi:hypothetical protein [Lysinibacillus sp. BPa_S21]|uniref:hypothetical protein n=1 Tax=Lysinibacillus sp. BPa_S21 TaxID=2932478 RepID=UPI0020135ED3|nr:hypothetical protein [Lysinibacillus sp. BPa_S21]MCL1696342.1 hypothetical protein [Lysinibacillus sp. BPa_S21]